MILAESSDLLKLEPVGPGRYQVPMPAGSQEGLNVVFGGQLMAQMIMAAAADVGETKYVKSMHTIFSPAGSHAEPVHLPVEPVHFGPALARSPVLAPRADPL